MNLYNIIFIGCDNMGIVYHGSKEHGIKNL